MTKNKWKFGLLSVTAVLSLAGCNPSNVSDVDYTYNTYLSTSPSNWNVHNWQTNDESYITSFTEMGLYDAILNEAKDGYTFVSEMAGGMPEKIDPADVDPEEIDKYYGDSVGNIVPGMVWDIPLNEKACWEDGTKITADDYLESMELQLNPKYANFRADSYYSGNFVLTNAENYYKQGRQTIEEFFKYKTPNGTVKDDSGLYYLNLGKHTSFIDGIFSNAEDITLISAFNSFETNYPALKLVCERISNAYNYYLWKAVDHKESSHKNDWERVTRADNVSASMVESDNVNIELDVFDNGFKDFTTGEETRIKTIKKLSDGSEGFDIWQDDNVEIYTRDMLEKDLKTLVSTVYRGSEKNQKWAWKLPLFTQVYTYEGDPITAEQIGIQKRGDYKIRFYLVNPITPLNLKFALTGNWLVKVDLYKKLTKQLGTGSYATTYAADGVNSYMSYGPYKLTYFEQGKEIKIERNDKWYGYTDGKHEGQFQMDEIDTKIYADHKTAMQEFLAGRLDDIDLTVSDVRDYGQSGRCTTTYESYTQKLSFNSDRSKLKARQTPGVNKTILNNDDFRKGLSLGLNRTEFASQATSGSKAFTGLLNDLYLANNSTGESYRSTTQGKSVYGQVYGHLGGDTIEIDEKGNATGPALSESAVGYNHALAVQYLAKGLAEELQSDATDHIKAGDNISLEFRVYDDSSENTIAAHKYIQTTWVGLLKEAVTVLKGNGTLNASQNLSMEVKMVKDQDYYTTARQGNYDMIFSTWGGAAVNPYGLMEVYCSASFDNICEYGFKGKQQDAKLWIDLNGDGNKGADEVRSFDKWYNDLNTGTEFSEAKFGDDIKEGDAGYEEYLTIHNKKLTVLAGLEAGIINRFEAIPLVARGTSSLLGFKVENATNTYVSLIGYGGIRFLKFNYTNSQWSEWCSSHKNQLGDLYKAYRN